MKVHGPVEHQVGVGIETSDQLFAVVVEIGLHLEPVPQVVDVPWVDKIAAESGREDLLAPIGDLSQCPGDGQTGLGPFAGFAVVVVATPEVRIGH